MISFATNMRGDRSERQARINFFSDTQPAIFWLPCVGGPCAGGTKICPTPDACRNPEEPADETAPVLWVWSVIFACCAMWAWGGYLFARSKGLL